MSFLYLFLPKFLEKGTGKTLFSKRFSPNKSKTIKLLRSLFDSNCNGNGHTNHGVVTCADETHHFYGNHQIDSKREENQHVSSTKKSIFLQAQGSHNSNNNYRIFYKIYCHIYNTHDLNCCFCL